MTQYGFDCRANAAYVTDDVPNTYFLGNPGSPTHDYPITRNGITFGWTTLESATVQGRDRNSGQGARFAGMVFSNAVDNPAQMRIDLPVSGNWIIRLAIGEPNYQLSNQHLVLKDDSSVFATITGSTGGANQYLDATGVNRSSPSDWITNNLAITRTFASTIFRLVLGDGATKNANLAHLLLESTDVAAGPLTLLFVN